MNIQQAWNTILNAQDKVDGIWTPTVKEILLENYKVKDFSKEFNSIQELVDKATPKNPIKETFKTKISEYGSLIENKVYCPTCKLELHIMGNCCSNNDCRQAIDWSNE